MADEELALHWRRRVFRYFGDRGMLMAPGAREGGGDPDVDGPPLVLAVASQAGWVVERGDGGQASAWQQPGVNVPAINAAVRIVVDVTVATDATVAARPAPGQMARSAIAAQLGMPAQQKTRFVVGARCDQPKRQHRHDAACHDPAGPVLHTPAKYS